MINGQNLDYLGISIDISKSADFNADRLVSSSVRQQCRPGGKPSSPWIQQNATIREALEGRPRPCAERPYPYRHSVEVVFRPDSGRSDLQLAWAVAGDC
jgi:hypothetical protein